MLIGGSIGVRDAWSLAGSTVLYLCQNFAVERERILMMKRRVALSTTVVAILDLQEKKGMSRTFSESLGMDL